MVASNRIAKTDEDSPLRPNQLVTIVVPVYNTPRGLLERCISSILSQTYPHIEIIIVDDGSDSKTQKTIDAIVKSDSRIRLLNGNHKGVSHARNLGIDEARGDWIAFCDSDDELADCFILHSLTIALSKGVDLVCGSVDCVFDGREKHPGSFSTECLVIDDLQGLSAAKMQMLGPVKYKRFRGPDYRGRGPVAKLYRKSLLGDLRYDESISIGEDALFNYFYIGDCCRSMAITDETWYWYYQYQVSSVHSAATSVWKSSIEGILETCDSDVDGRIASRSRCAYMTSQGVEGLVSWLGPLHAYRKAIELLKFSIEAGVFAGDFLKDYAPSVYLNAFVTLCQRNKLGLAYWFLVFKMTFRRLLKKTCLIRRG